MTNQVLKGDEEALNDGEEAFKGNGLTLKIYLKALIGDAKTLMGNR